MPKYRYTGLVPVKCAGRVWEPGDEAEAVHAISHPHFEKVRPPRKAKEMTDASTPDN